MDAAGSLDLLVVLRQQIPNPFLEFLPRGMLLKPKMQFQDLFVFGVQVKFI